MRYFIMRIIKILTIFIVLIMITSIASAGYGGHHGKYEKRHHGYYEHGHRYKYPGWHDRDNWKPPCYDCGDRGCRGGCDIPEPPEDNSTCPSGDCDDDECDNGSCNTTEPQAPDDPGETSTVTLCKNNVCSVGGTGKTLKLVNYANAEDPTYDELMEFLKADKTDERPYTSNYVCADFAVTLHDNAEKAGIKAGWVGAYGCDHAFNVFNTTDKGTVYIDCTGQKGGGKLLDAQLNCRVGQPLTGDYLFRDGTVNYGCKVTSLVTYW